MRNLGNERMDWNVNLAFHFLKSSKLLCSATEILRPPCNSSLLYLFLDILIRGWNLFCWGVPVLFPVLTKRKTEVWLWFFSLFLSSFHSLSCLIFRYTAPAVLAYLSPRYENPVFDQAGRWLEDITVGFSHTQSSGSVLSKVCARRSVGVWAGC